MNRAGQVPVAVPVPEAVAAVLAGGQPKDGVHNAAAGLAWPGCAAVAHWKAGVSG